MAETSTPRRDRSTWPQFRPNDKGIGELIAEVMEKVAGRRHHRRRSKGLAFETEYVEGCIRPRLHSPYFVTDPERMEAVLEAPLILNPRQRFSAQDIIPCWRNGPTDGRTWCLC